MKKSRAIELLNNLDNLSESEMDELEEYMAKNAKTAYEFAKNVIKGRFVMGETAIVESAEYSFKYLVNVLKVKHNNYKQLQLEMLFPNNRIKRILR